MDTDLQSLYSHVLKTLTI